MELPAEAYIVRFCTTQVVQFKSLLDVLKDLITECTLRFDEEGFKIITLDPTRIGMIHVSINMLEEYRCDVPVNASVLVPYLYRIMRAGTSNHHLCGYILHSEPLILHMRLEYTEKRTHVTHRVKLMDLPVQDITVPEVNFDLVLSMPSNELQRHIKELSHVSNVVTVRNQGTALQLVCCGDSGDACIEVLPTPSGLNWLHRDTSEETYEERFFIKYLEKFSRGSVDPTVQLFLKRSFPLIMRFQLTIGSLRFCVAPIRDQTV